MSDDFLPARRSTDNLVIEMHGMLSALNAQFIDHIKQDDKHKMELDGNLKNINSSLAPLKDFHDTAKTAGKIALWVSMPTFTAIGIAVWKGLSHFLVQNGK